MLLEGNKSKISVTTALQTFGLIVTAEPYFAVSEPSDAVVLENVALPRTRAVQSCDIKVPRSDIPNPVYTTGRCTFISSQP